MAGLAGRLMRFDFGAGPAHMRVTRCRSKLSTQLVESTNSESVDANNDTNEEFVTGVKSGDIDIDVVYHAADLPFGVIPDGASGTATYYPDKGQAGKKLTGTLLVADFEFVSDVKGLTTSRITGKFSGGRTVANL
jgi:hypothetical protein